MVVGEGETREVQTRRFDHQLFGVAGPVKETEAGVGV